MPKNRERKTGVQVLYTSTACSLLRFEREKPKNRVGESGKVLGVLSAGVSDRVGLLCPQGPECILCLPRTPTGLIQR